MELPVQCRIDPILVFCYCNLAVVRCHGLRDSAEICNGVIVDAKPVCNIAAGHTFDVKVVAVGKRGYKYGYFGFPLRVMSVRQPQRLSGVVKFETNSRRTWNMECHVFTAKPPLITSAILPIAQRLFSVHFTGGIVLLPQMLECFALAC